MSAKAIVGTILGTVSVAAAVLGGVLLYGKYAGMTEEEGVTVSDPTEDETVASAKDITDKVDVVDPEVV